MLNRAKEGNVKIGETDMDYISFGHGSKNLIIIPGLGDGLRTVKGTRLIIAKMYKIFAEDYKVYVFSIKNELKEGYSTLDMAKDQIIAMDNLGIEKADIIGISQGGMIVQYMAINFQERINKLVIGVSLSRQNNTVQNVVNNWIQMAENDDYESLVIDTIEKTFTKDYVSKYTKLYPIIKRVGKPKNFDRFLIQANSCINHNSDEELSKIKVPTLVLGGKLDEIVGEGSSERIAERIDGSRLIMYDDYGHGVFEENKKFNEDVLKFLRE